MGQKKLDFDLEGVPKTLLLPLAGRAFYSQEENSPIHDEKAIELVNSINYDFDDLFNILGKGTLSWWAARAFQLDKAIREYLRTHESATIVNLGAGLETAFYRTDNGNLTWVDLDLPDVIKLREKLLTPPNRVHYIAKSVLDYSWMDEVKQFGRECFFIAGGLFMYFPEENVKSLFSEMALQFPHSELAFDAITKKHLHHHNKMLSKSKMGEKLLQWGTDNYKDILTWSPKLVSITRTPFFKNVKTRYNFPLSFRIKMFYYDIFSKGGILHLKFS